MKTTFNTYITFVKGDIAYEEIDKESDYYRFVFYVLCTAIINVTLLNIVVSQMGEALQEVIT